MAGLSPTQRTLKHLRDMGLTVATVERWIPRPGLPGGGFKLDAFGWMDLLAVGPDGIVGVQSTGQDFSGHLRTLTEDRAEEVRQWLEAGGRVMLIGWRRLKVKRGGRAMVWQPRVKEITLADLGLESTTTVNR